MADFDLQSFINMINDPNNTVSSLSTASNGQDTLHDFYNTPGYQLTYGTNNTQANPLERFFGSAQAQSLYGSQQATDMAHAANTGTYDPTQAFHADPGFQFNMDEALRQVQQASAAKGLLESGATQRDLTHVASGLQNQEYSKWLTNQQTALGAYQGNQQNLYNSYQQQLASLANMGMGQANAQASETNSLGGQLASLLGGYNMQTGQSTAQAQLGTGSNISQLLANLGVWGGNAYINTGAAMANNLMNVAAMNMQASNNAQAGQAGTESNSNAGAGALQGLINGNGNYSSTPLVVGGQQITGYRF